MSLSDGIDDGGLIMIIRMLQAFLGFVEILDEWLRKPLELQRSQIVVQMTMSLMFLTGINRPVSTTLHSILELIKQPATICRLHIGSTTKQNDKAEHFAGLQLHRRASAKLHSVISFTFGRPSSCLAVPFCLLRI
jgi:hypothetical protein